MTIFAHPFTPEMRWGAQRSVLVRDAEGNWVPESDWSATCSYCDEALSPRDELCERRHGYGVAHASCHRNNGGRWLQGPGVPTPRPITLNTPPAPAEDRMWCEGQTSIYDHLGGAR
jgi:hypothetical protein